MKEFEGGLSVKVRESILRESTIMVSFQRMKEDFDDISTQVEIPILRIKIMY